MVSNMVHANRGCLVQTRFKVIVLSAILMSHLINLTLASVQSDAFNVDDILSADLMPGSFLVLESGAGGAVDESGVSGSGSGQLLAMSLSNGSYDGALSMMDFHRKKMNEFLCHNFLAEDILAQVTHKQNLQDRLGQPFLQAANETIHTPNITPQSQQYEIKNRLLEDEGSASYKDWLMRTATLEDIYRHHAAAPPAPAADRRASPYEPAAGEPAPVMEYEEGEVTGYAYHQPAPAAPSVVGKYGGYDYPPPYQHYAAAAAPAHEGSRGISLSDLFEISLTGLAFLSFGMFILQVFMCLGMSKQPTVMQMIDATEGDQMRFKRSSGASAAGPLVRRALVAMDTAIHMQHDNGACFKRHICESSAYSRSLGGGRQYWLPVWNFGLSWMSGIWRTGQPVALMSLEMLRSCVLGLGGANCASSYPDCKTDYR